jgi:ATP-binding cassette subfamily C protein LapB
VLLPETGQGTVLLGDAELRERATGLALYVRPHFRFDRRTEPH